MTTSRSLKNGFESLATADSQDQNEGWTIVKKVITVTFESLVQLKNLEAPTKKAEKIRELN